MASKSEFRPIRPTPDRNMVYQLAILLGFDILSGVALLAPAGFNQLLFALVVVIALVPFWLTVSSAVVYTGLSDASKRAKFGLIDGTGHRINVLISGVGVGTELYTAAPFGEEPEEGSYAAVLRANDEALLLVDLPVVYDERDFFEQLYQTLERSGYGLVTLHLHSMSALMLDRFIYWLYETHPVRASQIEAVHLISPAFRLRLTQRMLVLALRPYLGGPILQWLWDKGLWKIVWPENPIDEGRCDDDDRSGVFQLIRHRMRTLNVDRLLSNMSVMLRGRKLSQRREAPPFKLMVTEVATDECVDPTANRKILDQRFDGSVEYNFVTGDETRIGHHGESMAYFPRVYQTAAKRLIRLRDEASTPA